MNQMNNNDQIEKYLNNELSGEERITLENQIREDDNLKKEFERQQTAHRILDIAIAQSLKEQLMELEEESKVVSINRNKGRRFSILQWAAAASVLLVIGFFAFFFQGGQSDPGQLASAYYQMPDLNMQRSGEATPENILSRGLQALEDQDYATAVNTLDSISSENEFFLVAQYYLAHSHYLQGDYASAEQEFSRVSEGNDLRYKEEAEWYGLLACLQQGEFCTAKMDKIIKNNDHSYHEQAEAMQNSMK